MEMEGKVEVNRVEKEELSYELDIRGITGLTTVDSMRKSLRILQKDENNLRDSLEQSTKSLNSSGGPERSTNAWRRIFSDWKSAVKKRARAIKVGEKKKGGGPPEKPLNVLEQKLIDLSGVVVIDGFAGVSELGLLMNVSPVNTTLEASNDELSIDQTDNVQPGFCNRTNPAVSKMWTGSEHGSPSPKRI
ncbi:hypothetical protein JTB14_000001 [Gonioctena quinquepunctata]|nr:hypothetical protein JTB14_000001 [Gonioctena quinquepunctata]